MVYNGLKWSKVFYLVLSCPGVCIDTHRRDYSAPRKAIGGKMNRGSSETEKFYGFMNL